MNFAAMSDLHGTLITGVKPVDVVLIGGDITPLNIQGTHRKCRRWFRDTFLPWADSLPASLVVLVAGNHDMWMEHHEDIVSEMCSSTKVIYLMNQAVKVGDDIQIFGTPLCKPYGNWAFMDDYSKQASMFSEAKERLSTGLKTIVLSHDAPFGCSDIILDKQVPWYTTDHLGNNELRLFLDDIRPSLCLHGHLHSTNHDAEYIGDTEVRCISILGENYEPEYPVYYGSI